MTVARCPHCHRSVDDCLYEPSLLDDSGRSWGVVVISVGWYAGQVGYYDDDDDDDGSRGIVYLRAPCVGPAISVPLAHLSDPSPDQVCAWNAKARAYIERWRRKHPRPA